MVGEAQRVICMSIREILHPNSTAYEHVLLLYSLGCRLVHRLWGGGELTPLSSPMRTEQSVCRALNSDAKFSEVRPAKNLEISQKSWARPPNLTHPLSTSYLPIA